MYRISLGVVSLLAAATTPVLAAQTNGTPDHREILQAPPFDRAFWGAMVTGPSNEVVFELNADKLFVPASSAKLVVTAMASVLLGEEFTVTTDVYGTTPVENGVLDGDLIIVGHGDPTFGERCFGPDTTQAGACETMWSTMDRLADRIISTGVRQITGDIVGDGSYFEATIVHPAWESYDLNWWYAAPVSGLSFNDNSLNVTWGPGGRMSPATVSFEPNLGDFSFDNRTGTVNSGGETNVDFFRVPGTRQIWAEGTVAENRNPKTEYFAVADPNRFFATALRSRLERKGVSFGGGVVSSLTPVPVLEEHLLVRFESRRLEDFVYPILNSSQNLFAETLLKTVAAAVGKNGSWEAGVDLATSFLIDSVRVDSTSFEIHDGSGLASNNVLSPRTFIDLLTFMEDHPRNMPFMRALPRSGEQGSLIRRFIGTSLEGRVVAKTGSISHVNSLNGYVDSPDGRYKFSIVVNNQTSGYSAAVRRIDGFLVSLMESISQQ